MKNLIPIQHMNIYKDANYNTFPSVVKRPDGSILVGFRQAPDRRPAYGHGHLDPSSKAVTVKSTDGINWGKEVSILYDHFLYGVQDPSLNQLRDGTLLATFFMWKVMDQEDVTERGHRDKAVYGKWVAKPAGVCTTRSTDGGETWDEPIPFPIPGAVRGNGVELDDNSVLIPLYCRQEGGLSHVRIMRTSDRGQSWSTLAVIESEDGHHFHEPTLHKTPAGKLIIFTRSLNSQIELGQEERRSPLYTFESEDNGHTWSRPVQRAYYSPSPFHALQLDNGTVMLTYGYRQKPYGIRVILLDQECVNWEDAQEIVLREDGEGFDIGYTSAVQLDDGKVLVTYYYFDKDDGFRYIAGTLCEIV